MMDEDDLKREMPSSNTGQRMFIKSIIRKCKDQDNFKFETFRQFDTEVKSTDGYRRGSFLDTTRNMRAKKTDPLRNFHPLKYTQTSHQTDYMLEHCAKFASACINGRRNGTIYFAISEKGEVVGLEISPNDFNDDLLPSMFFEHQKVYIENTVRPARFVPVICQNQAVQRYVVEFDIVPNHRTLTEEDLIKINAKSLPDFDKKVKVRDPIYKFSEEGLPSLVPPGESFGSSKVPQSDIKKRELDELGKTDRSHTNTTIMRLRNFLTEEGDKISRSFHTFLLLSPIQRTPLAEKSHFEFIKHLHPKVVFDFNEPSNPSGDIQTFLEDDHEEVMKVATIDDFDEDGKDKKEMATFLNDLGENNYTNWVFCNGYGPVESLNEHEWNKNRSEAFETAFRHYVNDCGKDRFFFIICLFSDEYGVLLEACQEILKKKKYSEQWLLLCESQSVADEWQKKCVQRKILQEDLKQRCIIGLPWKQVNQSITSWCGRDALPECHIPHSKGWEVRVSQRKLNEWSDVEVVSTRDPVHLDDEENTAKQKAAEEHFYRGGQVQWLNFYFSNQVCLRNIHDELLRLVSDALQGTNDKEEEKIPQIYLYHEPGAGGTTSARQILWSLRKQYRCCLITEITSQTVDQIAEIFSFDDESPNPLLLLLDNEDEDKFYDLRLKLEKKARSTSTTDVFCVLLICHRMVFIPFRKRKQIFVNLKQSLHKQDLSWFLQKNKYVEKHYKNPKTLIGFNIMRENFKLDSIRSNVEDFLSEIKDSKEVLILKIVSLINHFDLEFRTIPVSCFDVILKSDTCFTSSVSKTGQKTNWETSVSQSFKFLLNLSSGNRYGENEIKTIRIFHKLAAKLIFEIFRDKLVKIESVSDIMSFVLINSVFSETGKDMSSFQTIISNMVKKRGTIKEKKNIIKARFSPLILYIMKKEGTDKAGELMETLFNLNCDPFTAQQIARFYIENQNYQKAEKYAKMATDNRPHNSYMWDTYALVFKAQLVDKVQKESLLMEDGFTNDDVKEIIDLCQKCTYYFQKERSVNKEEALLENWEVNHAAYLGELRSVVLMLKAMQKSQCFESEEVIHAFLVNEGIRTPALSFLTNEEIIYLQKLWSFTKETIQKLDDDFLQIKLDFETNPLSSNQEQHDKNKQSLFSLRVTLIEYFGERCDDVPSNLSEVDECKFRWRIVFSKRASSLSNLLQLKYSSQFDTLEQCYRLMLENVLSEHSTIEDYRTLLGIVTVLMIDQKIPIADVKKFEEKVIVWSKELYHRYLQQVNVNTSLEPFLYFALYNFPTEERLKVSSLACEKDLETALKNWKAAFKKERNVERLTHKETTLFFLGNGPPLKDIVYQEKLNSLMEGYNNHDEKWNLPELCNLLKLMKGILSSKGDYINYPYKSKGGNRVWIDIKTANRIKNKLWFQKNVYFYLGFSWSGLKAYGITNEIPLESSTPRDNPRRVVPSAYRSDSKRGQTAVKSLRELEQQKDAIVKNINERKKKRQRSDDLKKDLIQVESNIWAIIGE